jgi:hypothetical protein
MMVSDVALLSSPGAFTARINGWNMQVYQGFRACRNPPYEKGVWMWSHADSHDSYGSFKTKEGAQRAAERWASVPRAECPVDSLPLPEAADAGMDVSSMERIQVPLRAGMQVKDQMSGRAGRIGPLRVLGHYLVTTLKQADGDRLLYVRDMIGFKVRYKNIWWRISGMIMSHEWHGCVVQVSLMRNTAADHLPLPESAQPVLRWIRNRRMRGNTSWLGRINGKNVINVHMAGDRTYTWHTLNNRKPFDQEGGWHGFKTDVDAKADAESWVSRHMAERDPDLPLPESARWRNPCSLRWRRNPARHGSADLLGHINGKPVVTLRRVGDRTYTWYTVNRAFFDADGGPRGGFKTADEAKADAEAWVSLHSHRRDPKLPLPESSDTVRASPPYERTMGRIAAYARRLGIHAVFRLWNNPHSGQPHGIELTDFFARETGTGAGTKVMTYLSKLCDEGRVTCYTHPSSMRNTQFYKRFGFNSSQHHGLLVRFPPIPDDAFEGWVGEKMKMKMKTRF